MSSTDPLCANVCIFLIYMRTPKKGAEKQSERDGKKNNLVPHKQEDEVMR